MSRRMLTVVAGLIAAGFGLGIAEAGKWLRTLSVPGSPWEPVLGLIRASVWFASALIILGIVAAGYAILAGVVAERPAATLARAAAAAGGAVAAGWVVRALSEPFFFVSAAYLPTFTVALAISAALLLHLLAPPECREIRRSARRGGLVAAGWAVFVLAVRAASDSGGFSFGGFGVFAALAAPARLRTFPILLDDILYAAIFGALVGPAVARAVARGRVLPAAGWGTAAAVYISAVLYVGHSLAATVIMQSAYSERVACAWSLALGPVAGAIISAGVITVLGQCIRPAFRFWPAAAAILLLAAGGWYVKASRAGSDLYLAALNTPSYGTRVYIHFTRDGGWTRTREAHADYLKIPLSDRLVREWPRSVYAAEALYLKARSEFASWQFDKAAKSLELLRSRHPGSRGASTMLLAHTYLALGRFDAVVSGFGDDDPSFVRWARSDGAQMIGRAYEVLGLPEKARGLYAYYIEHLAGSRSGAWTTPAIQYAEFRTSRVAPNAQAQTGRGTVHGRVIAQTGGLPGVYVALVQPHLDASSPGDSRQFAGALTVPLWFGAAATTQTDGAFVMRGVPYGEYEVVVGFDTGQLPEGLVVSQAVPPVAVDRADVRLPDIRLVPTVRPVSPVEGAVTDRNPTLVWQPHPAAAYYSVSIVSRPNLDPSGAADGPLHDGYTCWLHRHIPGTSVKVTTDGFAAADGDSEEFRSRSLVPNRSYMWIVFAYDETGRLISSSEHYRLDHEPIFVVKSDDSKGR